MHKSLRLGMFSLLVLAVSLFGIIGFASAAQPILKAIPSSAVVMADGVTQYSITIQADSTPLTGIRIRGIQLDYAFPSIDGFQFNYIGQQYYPQNDFFAGVSTSNNFAAGDLISRLTGVNQGPVEKVGNFATIYFTVSQTSPIAVSKMTSLVMQNDESLSYFRNASNSAIKYYPIMESVPFTVINAPTRIGTASPHTQAILTSSQESCPIGQTC